MGKPEWDERIARASELAGVYPFAAEILSFYARIAGFQSALYDEASQRLRGTGERNSLRDQLDLTLALQHLPALLTLVEQHGPPGLARIAGELRQHQDRWLDLFSAYVIGARQQRDPAQFFARVCLQPGAESLACQSATPSADYTGALCPLCNAAPLMAVLRPEGDGAKRFLLCAFCQQEWVFRRIVCPACGERDYQKLPRYSAPDFPHVRVEACDTCNTYLKSVDLTVNGLAVPLVDEIAAAPLDLWAVERGYAKIALNLMGS